MGNYLSITAQEFPHLPSYVDYCYKAAIYKPLPAPKIVALRGDHTHPVVLANENYTLDLTGKSIERLYFEAVEAEVCNLVIEFTDQTQVKLSDFFAQQNAHLQLGNGERLALYDFVLSIDTPENILQQLKNAILLRDDQHFLTNTTNTTNTTEHMHFSRHFELLELDKQGNITHHIDDDAVFLPAETHAEEQEEEDYFDALEPAIHHNYTKNSPKNYTELGVEHSAVKSFGANKIWQWIQTHPLTSLSWMVGAGIAGYSAWQLKKKFRPNYQPVSVRETNTIVSLSAAGLVPLSEAASSNAEGLVSANVFPTASHAGYSPLSLADECVRERNAEISPNPQYRPPVLPAENLAMHKAFFDQMQAPSATTQLARHSLIEEKMVVCTSTKSAFHTENPNAPQADFQTMDCLYGEQKIAEQQIKNCYFTERLPAAPGYTTVQNTQISTACNTGFGVQKCATQLHQQVIYQSNDKALNHTIVYNDDGKTCRYQETMNKNAFVPLSLSATVQVLGAGMTQTSGYTAVHFLARRFDAEVFSDLFLLCSGQAGLALTHAVFVRKMEEILLSFCSPSSDASVQNTQRVWAQKMANYTWMAFSMGFVTISSASGGAFVGFVTALAFALNTLTALGTEAALGYFFAKIPFSGTAQPQEESWWVSFRETYRWTKKLIWDPLQTISEIMDDQISAGSWEEDAEWSAIFAKAQLHHLMQAAEQTHQPPVAPICTVLPDISAMAELEITARGYHNDGCANVRHH